MTRPPSTVAILGAGPAGLLAAHAAALAGRDPVLFDPREGKPPSQPAVYVHEPIPELCDPTPDADIAFIKIGKRNGYAKKVYGDERAPCSWDKFEEGPQAGWSLDKLVDRLWERYGHRVVPVQVDRGMVEDMVPEFPLIVSTIPAPILCDGSHEFRSKTVYFQENDQPIPRNAYVYNGLPGVTWYRASRLFGGPTVMEYAEPPLGLDYYAGTKPLETDCDCLPEVFRAGRFGSWRKGVLLNHAFKAVFVRVFEEFEGAE